ncbi:hypothetical protein M758_5G025400 [Ceratodon purpureus]|uniref:Protein HIRA n=1 Tax=Ceratodon purpureus TaxID=3225 RepID=A0A8T0HYF2_CERPU|nr:hypothetical protein KC19_5G023900 [Ceratodon purpureus]KAG0615230.1 hypothetical protein M758_5G025400 [Ceratodon purpureus]
MIVEKPTWLRHAGLQIFSVDTQPNGLRFATAGGDHKVRIWNMRLLAAKEADSETKLLATLRDHFGSVNCVRWAKCGQRIASGSDDQVVLVHEKRPGSGTTEFGSGEPPDVENWKVLLTLRGHTADVVDLGWSPDDTQLASCSLDNTVRIWQASTGAPLAVLTGHESLVKGLTWDPIGSFLATQSDDKSVIIWRTSNWTLVKRVEGPWEKTVGSTFFRRLGWSPCGHFIATTHGFQNPSHTAPVLERGEWMASFDFVGHNAPVVAVRFNHSMFRKMKKTLSDEASSGAGNGVAGANGSSSSKKDAAPYNVIAIGSQDCCISVWTTGSPRPVFIGKHFFQQSVVDLSWSPDGYTLFCCSLDGSVASFQFEVKELGEKISDAEMEEFKKSRYGDLRVRQATVAESPAQLMLEAAAAKQWGSGNAPTANSTETAKAVAKVPSAKSTETAKAVLKAISAPSLTTEIAKAVPKVVSAQNSISSETPKAVPKAANGAAAPEVPTKLPTKVPPKPPPAAAPGADVRNGSVVPNVPPVRITPSPVKQTEYRRPDGRRRIIPEPLGPPRGEDVFGNGALHSGAKYDAPNTGMGELRKQGDENLGPSVGVEAVPKRKLPDEYIRPDVPPAKRSNGAALDELASAARSSPAAVVAIGVGNEGPPNIPGGAPVDMVVPAERMTTPEGVLSIRIRVPDGAGGEDSRGRAPICLEARPAECTMNLGSVLGSAAPTSLRESSAKAKVICSQGGEVRWCDYLISMPTALAGNSNFWAVACGDGSLQIYTMAGRRAQPSMMLGSAAVFMDCDENWKLMVVTRNGSLHLWDLQESKRLLHESLGPLLNSTSANSMLSSNGTMKLASARLSKAGAPLVVLANRHAFIFNLGMCCWLRVADDTFPASNFVSTWPDSAVSADNGELALLQAGVARAAGPSFLWNRLSLAEEKWQTRVHLEVQMSSALALKSASEYRRCLIAYARCLTKESDEARLRELCEELMGPVHLGPSSHSSTGEKLHSWKPDILGLRKRELLKEVVLPAMASNRAIQRLLNEFVDLVTECEAAQKASEPGGSIL